MGTLKEKNQAKYPGRLKGGGAQCCGKYLLRIELVNI